VTIIILSFLSILLTVCAQLLLKTGARKSAKLLFNAYVFLGYSLFMVIFLVNGYLMQRFDLKYFSLIFAGNYLFTNVCAVLLFKESVTGSYYAGLACIVAGVLVFNV
jgi:drug/metabolite transporter (DMT)-like permease